MGTHSLLCREACAVPSVAIASDLLAVGKDEAAKWLRNNLKVVDAARDEHEEDVDAQADYIIKALGVRTPHSPCSMRGCHAWTPAHCPCYLVHEHDLCASAAAAWHALARTGKPPREAWAARGRPTPLLERDTARRHRGGDGGDHGPAVG